MKSGVGDIKRASSLENIALFYSFAGVVAACTAILVPYYGKVKFFWPRAVVLYAMSPVLTSIYSIFIIQSFVNYQNCP
jgi:uncharacterized membrane protein (DUF485 family)